MVSVLPFRSDTDAVVPAAVRGHPNGRIPAELLHPCGIRSFVMVEPAASAMRVMVAAASGDGVKLSGTGTWRTFDEQKSLFLDRYVTHNTGKESKTWDGRAYWRRPDVASAATPGTSNHGFGLAVDFSDAPTVSIGAASLKWLAEHGPSFGFWNTVKSETWHWTYCLGDDVPEAVRAAGGSPPPASPLVDTGAGPATGLAPNTMLFPGEFRIGAVGDAVRAVQARLVVLGHDIEVDGVFGRKTLAAVKAMQGDHGLVDDGRVGQRTWAVLGLTES